MQGRRAASPAGAAAPAAAAGVSPAAAGPTRPPEAVRGVPPAAEERLPKREAVAAVGVRGMANSTGVFHCWLNTAMLIFFHYFADQAADITERALRHIAASAGAALPWREKVFRALHARVSQKRVPRAEGSKRLVDLGDIQLGVSAGRDAGHRSADFSCTIAIPDAASDALGTAAGQKQWWTNTGMALVERVDAALQRGSVLLCSKGGRLALAVGLVWMMWRYPHRDKVAHQQLLDVATQGEMRGFCWAGIAPLVTSARQLLRDNLEYDGCTIIRHLVLTEFGAVLAHYRRSQPGAVLSLQVLRSFMAVISEVFAENETGDPSEAVTFFVTMLDEEQQRYSGAAASSVRQWWGIPLRWEWGCPKCGLLADLENASVFTVDLMAADLAASTEDAAFYRLLGRRNDPRTCRGCTTHSGAQMPCNAEVRGTAILDGRPPRMLNIVLYWPQTAANEQVGRDELRKVLSAIPGEFPLERALGNKAAGKHAVLRCVAGHHGAHKIGCIYNAALKAWVSVDDRLYSAVCRTLQGIWRYIVAVRTTPQLLVYEVRGAPASSAPQAGPGPGAEPGFEGQHCPPPQLLGGGDPNRGPMLQWLRRNTPADQENRRTAGNDALAEAISQGDQARAHALIDEGHGR
eukprot:TRINITY_DN31971_c0_g3_i2.p1 TRINITY_DN31971_c0_g3~~TRINITY_DN31971_c0_g3_i2.p1  ORF type:complete len:667 (+),score=173.98 TRINITY_DN31971_c0_g3_i2:104-2002(+)